MKIILNKEFEKIQADIIEKLQKSDIDATPGSIAKLFSDAIVYEMSTFYEMLQEMHKESFLSTATGSCLNAIGKLLDCTRKDKETDEDFRNRISIAIRTIASANFLSIRLKVLSIEGINDMAYKEYTHGSGSFTVAITTDDNIKDYSKIAIINEELKSVVAYGTRYTVIFSEDVKLSMKIKLELDETINSTDAREVNLLVRDKIINYINSIGIGRPFIVNELTEQIMSVSESIITYECEEFKVNGRKEDFININNEWASRFVVSTEKNSVNVY